MKVTSEDHGMVSIMTMVGDFTTDHVDSFRRTVTERCENGTRDFVLQVGDVPFVDSAALEALLWLQDKAAEQLGQIRLVALSENVSTILRLTRLEHQFDCHQDVTQAVRSLR